MTKKYIKDLAKNEGIHAPTIEIAEKLCKRFDELGYIWAGSKSSFSEDTKWNVYEFYTVYFVGERGYGHIEDAIKYGYTLYTISDLLDFENSQQTELEEIRETLKVAIDKLDKLIGR